MKYLPEQSRALAYAKRRGTDSPISAIRARVAGTYAELEALLDTLTAEQARRQTAASRWSVHEVADHLLLSDRPAARQLGDLLRGVEVDEAIAAHLQSPRPFAVEWTTLRGELSTVHREIEALLERASDDTPAVATAAVSMVVKCAGPDGHVAPVEWIERFDWKAYAILLHAHNREHLAQIERILTAPG